MMSLRDRFRTLYYRVKYQYVMRKATFGPNTQIGCRLIITGPGKITVGAHCRFVPDPWGQEYVTLYTHRDRARVRIGDHVTLRATRLGSHLAITIKDGAILESASLFDSDFHNIDATRRDDDFNKDDREVVIGEGTYVGIESLCSKGAFVGDHVIVLAGTVMGGKNVPGHTIVGGNPAMPQKR